ncbi:glycosyltransferase [Actinoplanes sp. N902-109]|uniref:glycosyltransferase n=1 Tax=Actinoplanes sp. (strain N902-109) TaxID=649831 RepID=UPI000329340B|nr:glycosyltransferase [Actinoplanes sp. N902-109]AGL16567.1 glycosyl transferase [Actinoplanes sp. N902-109]
MGVTGWYIHHHGAGHLTRFRAVRPYLPGEVVVFSSLPGGSALPPDTAWVHLDPDNDRPPGAPDPAGADPTVGGLLHWAPLGHAGHARRFAAVAAALAARRFDRFVVDVSVEVALLVRLLGVPTVVVTQPGERSDTPHRLAYASATRILAPWPAGVHPSPAAHRCVEVGGISRFDSRSRTRTPEPGTVLVLGGGVAQEDLAAAASATPGTRWLHAGATAGAWVEDPWEALQHAEVVVTAAGQNSIADLAAADARAVVVPQPRPFDEQLATGRVLDDRRLAVVAPAWPSPAAWPAILDRARDLRPDWTQWEVTGAARRAAATIAEVGS